MDRQFVDRVVDIASVVLISVTAVLSALSGYESSRWGGQQARFYNIANAERIQSAAASDKSSVLTAIDVGLFLHYIDAVDTGDKRMESFLSRRFRREMRPAMTAWLATKPLANSNAPSSPFVMPEYKLETAAEAKRDGDLAAAAFNKAQEATRNADEYLLLTVIFAGVSFLAGISTKMLFPRHLIVVAVGYVGLIYGLVRLSQIPFR